MLYVGEIGHFFYLNPFSFSLVCLPAMESSDDFKYDGKSARLLRWGADDHKTLELKRPSATIYDNG
jgi:hypothetical protein